MFRGFFMVFLIIFSLNANELPSKYNSLDAYSEYNYKYFKDGISISTFTLLKYKYSLEKEQFGFRDILLFSLREIAKEARARGFENFHIVLNNNMYSNLEKQEISIDEFLDNFNPKKYDLIYPYYNRKSSGLGSALSLGANLAVATVAVNNISSGNNNVSASSDALGNSLDGVMTNKKGKNIFNDLTNKNEIDSINQDIFYNTIEMIYFFNNKNDFLFKEKFIKKIDVSEVERYFKKNPFRIKELYTTDKYLLTRGIQK